MIRRLILLAFALSIHACTHPVFAQETKWKIKKTQWSQVDEQAFQNFVQKIGEAVEARKCRTVIDCMKSDVNTYRHSDPPGLRYFADCADFPYFVRAYFAWKNGLPFTFADEMKHRPVKNNGGDLRYSRYGNVVTGRTSMAATSTGVFPDAVTLLNRTIRNQTSSANYRTNWTGNDTGEFFSDFYPVKVNRQAIQAGSILYDPNGHVTMVYRVSDDGRVYFVDAHPDNSLTTGQFGVKFVRSNPGQGAGFKNWRPYRLEGASQDTAGNWIGGKVVAATNTVLPLFSGEQFFGTELVPDEGVDWTKSQFVVNGKKITYYEFVRLKMAVGELRLDPVAELRNSVETLCETLIDRVHAVDTALKAGIQNQTHPPRLPDNIYGTSGDWETYSTPSRDAQLKVTYMDLLEQSRDFIKKLKAGDPSIVYTGVNLAQDLKDVYEAESRRCEITYTNTSGQGVTLNLEDVRLRLFKLSFDPYHCAELRWGAGTPQELATCQDSSEKRLWYEREQRLRNQPLRRYDLRMDFSLEDLAKPLPGNGLQDPPDVDLVKYLMTEI